MRARVHCMLFSFELEGRLIRPRILIPSLLLLAVFAYPARSAAQFQEPTQEELKLTADPKAPGAAAMYLYREDITDQTDNSHTYYERIKVLTEKGKELATVRIPYEVGTDKVTELQARTIHADGAVIPLTEKPADLVDYKSKDVQFKSEVFTMPAVDVGSILEYRVRVKYAIYVAAPTWWIQQPYYVRKAHYAFKSNSSWTGLGYEARIGSDAKVVKDKKGFYALDLTDVPPLPDEDWMPPLNIFKWRVEFFYSDFSSNDAYWKEAGRVWSEAVRDFANPSGLLKKTAAELIAPGDSEMQKARKIYAEVMKLENTDFTRHKSEVERKKEKIKDIHKAEDVWKERTGTSDELALLYVALARAAGLEVEPMKVVDRNRALFDESLLNSRQLDDYIAVAQLDGKEIFLDPGEKMCAFGTLHWKHSLATGFRLAGKEGSLSRTPGANYKESSMQRVADISIDASGAVSGPTRFILTGQDALYWRQVALENDQDEVKKRFNEFVQDQFPEGVQVNFDHFIGLDDYESNLIAVVKIGGNIGAVTGKHMFFPGLLFQARAKHPFIAQDKRATPIDVHYPKTEADDVTYRLPPGWVIESAPQNSSGAWPGSAVFQIASKANGDTVKVERTLLYNFTILGPADYPNLRDFYLKLAAADQQQLVLARASAAKGN